MTLAFLPNLGWQELLIIGVIMLLLFGRRLPEVGKSLGQGIVQFKRGLKEVGDEIERESSRPSSARPPLQSGERVSTDPIASEAPVEARPEPPANA